MEVDLVQRRRLGGSTADKTALQRAIGAMDEDEERRNPDYLAAQMVADLPEVRLLLRLAAHSRLVRAVPRWSMERLATGGYWHELARVRHFDSVFLEQASAGVPQMMLLGAGLDSRCYRFAAELAGARAFEVDHPVVAARKRVRVRDVFGELPEHVTYVSVDLSEDELDEPLLAAGFDPDAPVFVLWIGVSMYLREDSFREVLRWVSRRPAGSSLAFDYLYRDVVEGKSEPLGHRVVHRALERSGEPLLFGLDPGAVPDEVEACGLTLRSHLDSGEISRRWLRRRDGTPIGRIGDLTGYVHAEVPA